MHGPSVSKHLPGPTKTKLGFKNKSAIRRIDAERKKNVLSKKPT